MWKLRKIINYRLVCLLFILVYVLHFAVEKSNFKYTTTSDGEGYYSYLPALYLFGDNTFQTNAKVKYQRTGQKDEYVILTNQGTYVNKYFSGVSFIAAPAFLTITGILKLSGSHADGYNDAYFIGMFFYSILMFVFGFILYQNTVSEYFQLNRRQKWAFLLVLIAAPWLFSAMYGVMWANNYLFICFSILLWLITKMKKYPEKSAYLLGFFFLTGIVAITRPTSLIFLVMVLFFFDSLFAFWEYLRTYVLKPKILIAGFILFLLPVFYQFGIWKWQTGSFFLWSYSGEGFNWFNPQLIEIIFSYRTGILFHSPVLIFCLIYALVTFRNNRYKAIVYLVYFFLICYVSASWWCYDFESKHGLRNFNEHYVFLLLPLFDFIRSKKAKKWAVVILVITALLPFIRFNQYVLGYNTNQRFTRESYWESLAFWNPENKERWAYHHSLKPFGKRYSSKVLFQEESVKITPEAEFFLGKSIPVKLKTGERMYIKVSYDRIIRGNDKNKPPVFVIDFYNQADKNIRSYHAIPGYEDSQKEMEHVEISRSCFDYLRNMDELTIYFWNDHHVKGELKNLKVELEKYGP